MLRNPSAQPCSWPPTGIEGCAQVRRGARHAPPRHPCSCRSGEPGHAEQVVGGADEVGGELRPLDAAESRLAEATDGLPPAEDLLDELALALTDRVVGMPRGSRVDSRATRPGNVLRH